MPKPGQQMILAVRPQTSTRYEQTEQFYKEAVVNRLNYGDTFTADRDIYNTVNHFKTQFSKRKVVEFYRHFVLTVDVFGRLETYQYFDLYKLLKMGAKEEQEEQEVIE